MSDRIRSLLEKISSGNVTVEEGMRRLAWEPIESLPFATIDHHRSIRQGVPEVVFGAGKTTQQILGITERMLARGDSVLVTRIAPDTAEQLVSTFSGVERNALARTAFVPAGPIRRIPDASVLVISAGTSDLPVAEEAAETARVFGNEVERLVDVGVAGLHRLLGQGERLLDADVIIVVAGMEGALPSVVGGLVACPVIAVPTSVGYGASFQGLSALLGMLNSCASGLSVVNIDNGFGAAAAATRINLTRSRRP